MVRFSFVVATLLLTVGTENAGACNRFSGGGQTGFSKRGFVPQFAGSGFAPQFAGYRYAPSFNPVAVQRSALAQQAAAYRAKMKPIRMAKAAERRRVLLAKRAEHRELMLARKRERDRHTMLATRSWTDDTGSHRITAEYLGVSDGQVQLKRTDGLTVRVPLGRLSLNDRMWVSRQVAPIGLTRQLAAR